LLKARPLADALVRERLVAAFATHGVSADRLALLPHAPQDRHHLETYGQVDIALDTWPYQGVTTTCEALWMGVPVVSRCGGTAVSRQSLTLLPAVGLGHLAVSDDTAWLEACVALGADLAALKILRYELRDRMVHSDLMDVNGFARSFEDAMHAAWQDWCRRA
jgi:protein O-GlcNAc transferase